METKNNQEQKKELLKKIGRYSTAAGALLLCGNVGNAFIVPTITTFDLTPGYHGIDFDQDGLNELRIWVDTWGGIYTTTWSSMTFTYTSYGASAELGIGSDPDATQFQVIHEGPFDTNWDAAAFPFGRTIGPSLAGTSYWTWSNWDTLVWTDSGSVTDGNFGYYPGDTRYAGVRFSNDGGTNWYYGWIGIQIDPTPLYGTGRVGQVIDYAYNNQRNDGLSAGSASTVPLMPIASALGLGLVGLFGFLRARRKKAQ